MMKKIALSLLALLFPSWVFASSSASSALSFAPPAGDYSVVFLGDIFGVVDGVLNGTGSQIIGNMFGVFNSAVLALGGIVIMYTLIVSTMNTAQEGQMLGQKWSSIWVPLRATIGLGLLIPKASGYCLMQIFVMWVIVQGVGAADKVWDAALGYLNRGGVIVQTQMNPTTSLNSANSEVATGASVILQGQVCMAGLQAVLQAALQSDLNAKNTNGSGPCSGSPSDTMLAFCNSSNVPDFINTVNVVAIQNENPNNTTENYSANMPNFGSDSIYASLNGICGQIVWSPFSQSSINSIKTNITTLSSAEIETAKMSRAIAIQQMYMDLSSVARTMVNNDPAITPKANNSGTEETNNYSAVAAQQFGIPYLDSGSPCTTVSAQCTTWGQDSTNDSSPLFNGTEFQGAIADYNGIMLPTLNLYQQANSNTNANNERAFIQNANSQGWIMAGSYFYNLSILNASAMNNANLTDSNTGLDYSIFDPNQIVSPFTGTSSCGGTYEDLCIWLNYQQNLATQVVSLINGTGMLTAALGPPSVTATGHQAIGGPGSSTVNGFVNNSVMVNLPGQPGMVPPTFVMPLNISINLGQYKLQKQDFPCGEWGVWPIKFCLGEILGDVFYNLLIRNIFNAFLAVLAPFINAIIQSFLIGPLLGIAQIFESNVAIIEQPTVNPVIALANMGTSYINFANEIWILLIAFSATPLVAIMFPVIALILPLLLSWLGIMVAIAFITAYYIPFLPYMIFTFGSIAWLMAVIEAMVAAPIVALGVTHPEGHDAFGKGEQAIMILMNVFLRPSMMIIGYIAAIILSYVSVWVINAGFANASTFVLGTGTTESINYSFTNTWNQSGSQQAANAANNFSSMSSGYTSWAGIYGFFFSVIIYTTMYLVVVQKAFTLITFLPDKVLRWISGGQAEGLGEQSTQWAEGDVRKKLDEKDGAIDKTSQSASQRDQQLSGYTEKALGKAKGSGGGGSGISGT